VIPQAALCARDKHHWTAWGNFIPVPPVLMPRPIQGDVTPEYQPVEAYRWRYCECGAAERETWADWADHTVKRFTRDEMKGANNA
jgi:hypothetical protein